MSDVSETAKKLVVKNKLLFIFCISFIMLSLFIVCYLFFFRSITIDVAKDMRIEYSDESGIASVNVTNKAYNLNQRTQEFLDSITYQVTPNQNLSNGSIITIQAHWSKDLADKYNIQVINDVVEVNVDGLTERYEDASAIPKAFIETLDERANTYFERNMTTILNDEFTDFYVTSNTSLKGRTLVYRIFLKAMDIENKDKILDIYKISATGKINKGVEQEDLFDGESTIYYALTYDNINDSQKIEDAFVFGEKMLITSLDNQEQLVDALNVKYLLSYTMRILSE